MGTRHIIRIKADNKIKVQNYGQWDGYPTGQGAEIADFIQNKLNLKKLRANTKKLTWSTEKEIDKAWDDAVVASKPKSNEIEKKFKENHLHWSRDCGSDILPLIQDGEAEVEQYDFTNGESVYKTFKADVKSTLKCTDNEWCEYDYLVNLDKETVQVTELSSKKRVKYKFEDFTKDAMKSLEERWREEAEEEWEAESVTA